MSKRGIAESTIPSFLEFLFEFGKVPAFQASEEAKITRVAREVAQEGGTKKISYATEAGLFQLSEIPTIVCGLGSIMQAHKPNEFVTPELLHKCEKFLRSLALQLDSH